MAVVRASNAVPGATAEVQIRPPAVDRPTAARQALATVTWPRSPLTDLF